MAACVDPVVRLLRRRRVTDAGCWEWTGSAKSNGYAQIGYQGRMWTAHRLAWTLWRDPVPDNTMVLHRCDNRRCFNPDHLFLGTAADNTRDMMQKNRQRYLGAPGERNRHAKLTMAKVQSIRASHAPLRVVMADYGISRSQVYKIRTGQSWCCDV